MEPDKDPVQAFLKACATGNSSYVNEAISKGHLKRADLQEGLCCAVRETHSNIVAILFRAGVRAHPARDWLTGTQLKMPVIIRQFLNHGLDPNATLSNGEPFLCMLSNPDSAIEFLSRGADPNRRCPKAIQPFRTGDSPLARALLSATKQDMYLVELLLEYGAELEEGLLFRVLNRRLKDMDFKTKFLLDKGLNPNTTDKTLGTPLHRAVGLGLTDVVRVLVKAGADPTAKPAGTNCYYASPLDLAKMSNRPSKQAMLDILRS